MKHVFSTSPYDALFIGYADGRVFKTDLIKGNKPFLIPNFDGRTREWYKAAINTKKPGLSKPYIDVTTKNLTTTAYAPIIENGEVVAVIGANIFLNHFQEELDKLKITPTSQIIALDSDFDIVAHKNKKYIMTKDANLKAFIKSHAQKSLNNGVMTTYELDNKSRIMYCKTEKL